MIDFDWPFTMKLHLVPLFTTGLMSLNVVALISPNDLREGQPSTPRKQWLRFTNEKCFGKSHLPWYRYRCFEMSEEVFDTGFDKQLFKQSVARRLLEQLSLRGYDVPPHLSSPSALNELMDLVGLPTYSFVVLVSELCREYRLDPVEYEVLADAAGQPSITVKARIGYVERVATAASKRIAHQLAAEQIYKHLRTMLRGTRDFNEEEAMFRAYTRTMRQIGDEQGPSLGEQRRKKMEEQAAAKAEKNKQSSAVQATVLMELDQSEQTSYEIGSALPPPGTPNAPEQDGTKAQTPDGDVHQAAVQLLQLTMERLGI